MKTLWSRISTRIDSATLRERVMIFGALAVLVLAIADTVLFSPELAKQKRLNREVAQRQSDMAALQEQVTKLVEVRRASPGKALRGRLEQLQREIQATEATVAEEQRRFTRPDQMRAALEQMVGRHRNISLLELRSLPASGPQATTAEQKGAPKPERPVFRHAFEVTVAGRYHDLLAYVAALESMPTRLYWGNASLEVGEYPVATLKLVVFTLSLEKGWLSV